jgi:hypothetical protein
MNLPIFSCSYPSHAELKVQQITPGVISSVEVAAQGLGMHKTALYALLYMSDPAGHLVVSGGQRHWKLVLQTLHHYLNGGGKKELFQPSVGKDDAWSQSHAQAKSAIWASQSACVRF